MGFLASLVRALVSCLSPSQPQKPSDHELSQQHGYVPPVVTQPPVQHVPPSHHTTPQGQVPQAPQHHERPHERPHEKPHERPHEGHHAQSPPRKHSPGPRIDPNQVNQHNPHYTSLRARANEEGDKMASCFEQSHEAYQRGDGAAAKELSNEGKAHQREMERLNKEASDWIFIENNKDSNPGEVDLHGLYVKEAISYTDRSIQEAKARGDSEITS
ncbi:hypothetical protein QCA50_011690 [Cerrena zonata]|uniref:DUF1771 domain-containing protein n=1 Tax=Cerrena zonata TaxID=2478898 RepID=A0AAW0FWN7_9APHY